MHERYEGRDPDERTGDIARSGPSPLLIGFLIIAALAIVFVVQNGDEARVEFLFVDATAPVWVAIAIALVLGAVLDRLLLAWWRRRRRG